MLKSTTFLLAALALVSGCSADTDGDGLSDSEERKLGLDPANPDSDGDRLPDGDEAAAGTDASTYDSDGDGYADGDEITEGSDPTDGLSWIYRGHWPYNHAKDSIVDPGFNGGAVRGATMPRFRALDQFGDTVDLYDFAGQGKPILVDVSAVWCPPCRDMAEFMEGGNQSLPYTRTRRAVNQDEIYWVTIMGENQSGGSAGQGAVTGWYNDFPHEKVAVLADSEKDVVDWMDLAGWPTTMWLNDDMTIERYSRDDVFRALDLLDQELSGN